MPVPVCLERFYHGRICDQHASIIKIDTLVTVLPENIRKILDVVTSLITIFIVGVLFTGGVSVVAEVARTGQLTRPCGSPSGLCICAHRSDTGSSSFA